MGFAILFFYDINKTIYRELKTEINRSNKNGKNVMTAFAIATAGT
jgi:hypothetical protein